MKYIIILSSILLSSQTVASDDWLKKIDTGQTDDIVNIIKTESTWGWDKEKKILSICFKIPNRDMLCTNAPKEFTITLDK